MPAFGNCVAAEEALTMMQIVVDGEEFSGECQSNQNIYHYYYDTMSRNFIVVF